MKKIYLSSQIREIEQQTFDAEQISSIELMENASLKFAEKLLKLLPESEHFTIIVGKGNNAGDGLAIARILISKFSKKVTCYSIYSQEYLCDNAKVNFTKLSLLADIQIINTVDDLIFEKDSLVIDAIFGIGLNRPVNGFVAACIHKINLYSGTIVSVDLPSGLFSDSLNKDDSPIVKADYILTFEYFKLSFIFPEIAPQLGEIHILDIGISKHEGKIVPYMNILDQSDIQQIYKPRKDFSHKGHFGHSLLIVGSYGMMGAAVLAASSCVKAGSGKTTVHIPGCGYDIMQTSVPEAMVWADYTKECITTTYDSINNFESVGIGPGIGTEKETVKAVEFYLNHRDKPMVLDADALNILSESPSYLNLIPFQSIITPHVKEFDRLFGMQEDSYCRFQTAQKVSAEKNIIIVLKDRFTTIYLPNGEIFVNVIGNSGLAKGGSGDVLLGIITALLAQKYSSNEAAILGVYLHAHTADILIKEGLCSKESMLASDIFKNLHKSFISLST